jgi:hypothetical protein
MTSHANCRKSTIPMISKARQAPAAQSCNCRDTSSRSGPPRPAGSHREAQLHATVETCAREHLSVGSPLFNLSNAKVRWLGRGRPYVDPWLQNHPWHLSRPPRGTVPCLRSGHGAAAGSHPGRWRSQEHDEGCCQAAETAGFGSMHLSLRAARRRSAMTSSACLCLSRSSGYAAVRWPGESSAIGQIVQPFARSAGVSRAAQCPHRYSWPERTAR